jgi:hypothetical protein
LLANGKVLAVGGQNAGSDDLASVELYDADTGTWSTTGSLALGRSFHTATMLADGRVLVAGGFNTPDCEIYDPVSGTWTVTGRLNTPRYFHRAVLLSDGRVLVAGGFHFRTGHQGENLASAELYDPATGVWTFTGSLSIPRQDQIFLLLPTGKVLCAGGDNGGVFLATSELYNPTTGTWSATGSLTTARASGATLLPNGRVLAAGGGNPFALASAELYDSASGSWSVTTSLATARETPLTLLLDGRVLASGGLGSNSGSVTNCEVYDVGLGFTSASQPKVNDVKNDGSRFQLRGKRFQGISQASGGNTQDSSSNYPIVQLRNIDSGHVTFLPVDPRRGWSDSSFASSTLSGLHSGPALMTMFTNGIPSAAKYLTITQP